MSESNVPIPLNDTVILIEDPNEAQTKSGIHLPEGYRMQIGEGEVNFEATRFSARTGTVVAVGPGTQYPDGQSVPLSIMPGERVMFERLSGVEIRYEQGSYLVVDEKAILAVLGRE